MNERIKELATRASKDNSDGYPVTLIYTNRFAEKFGELIVRECAETIQDFVEHRFPASEYPVRLKRYFGVEE